MRFLIAVLVFLAGADIALAQLQTWPEWVAAQPYTSKQVPPQAVIMRGIGTDSYYVVEVDPATGAIPVDADIVLPSYTYADSVRNVYSVTPVTTGAWVQLIASTAAEIRALTIFDSSGQTLELGTGAAASETRLMLVPPGGIDGLLTVGIPVGTRLSVRAVSATASVGELTITGFN